jgi:hypothetical protein
VVSPYEQLIIFGDQTEICLLNSGKAPRVFESAARLLILGMTPG